MLDLEAGVRLDECEAGARFVLRAVAIAAVAALSGVDQELEGAQAVVLRGATEAQRRVDDRGAQGGGEIGRRRGLDDFLVPALGAALAFAEIDQPAVFVAQELDFDVARPGDQFLDVEAAVAERALGLGPATLVGLLDLIGRRDDAGSASTAAGKCLDDHCLARSQGGEELPRLLERRRPVRSAQDRHVHFGRRRARPALVAEQFQDFRPRTDEGDPSLRAGSGEVGVLGQEAVARMDRVAVRGSGAAHDILDVEICRHSASAERDGLVGDSQVESVRVVLGVDRDRMDAQIHRRAGDPYRDLAAVRYQETAHGLRRRAVFGFGAEGCALGPHLLQLL